MTGTNPTDQSLTLNTRRLTSPRHNRRLATLWATDPHLAGWTPTTLLEALTQRDHPCHDQLIRGLATRSQRRDEDATILLLAALQPALWKLAHTYHHNRTSDAFNDLTVNAIQTIHRLNPDQDNLYHRILGRIRAATPRQPESAAETIELKDRATGNEDDLVNLVAARDLVHRIGQLHEQLDHTSWDDLISVRIHGTPTNTVARGRTNHHVRADISRTSRRLRQLLAA
jgi:hypothetical protein